MRDMCMRCMCTRYMYLACYVCVRYAIYLLCMLYMYVYVIYVFGMLYMCVYAIYVLGVLYMYCTCCTVQAQTSVACDLKCELNNPY